MTETIPVRVFIVDDHDMLLVSLTVFFGTCDDLVLVGQARNGEEAVILCTHLQPDVVIVDFHLPGIDGIATTRLIHQHCPDTRFIMLTYLISDAERQLAMDAGVSLCLLKNIGVDELAAAVRNVAQK